MQESVDTSKLESNEHAQSYNHAIDNKDGYTFKIYERFPPGEMYWEYVLIYVDNLMIASQRASSVIEATSRVYILKEDKKTNKCFWPPNM